LVGGVADEAPVLLQQLLGTASGGCRRRRGGRRGGDLRRRRRGRRGPGGGWRRRGFLRRWWLLEARAGLVRPVHHAARDLVIAEIGVAAARRHRLDPVDRILHERVEPCLDVIGPRRLVAELGRVRDAGGVARGADLLVDLLAGLRGARARRALGED